MKTKLRFISLLLSAVLLLSLCACVKEPAKTGETETQTQETPFVPQDAKALWEKINEVMDALSSYSSNMKTQITAYQSGLEFKLSGVADAVYVKSESDPFEWSSMTQTIDCESADIHQTMSQSTAYSQGKMYYAYQDDEHQQKFVSTLSYEDFCESEKDALIDDIDFLDAASVSFEKTSDGWSMKCQKYTSQAVKKLVRALKLPEEMLGGDVLDVEVTITANEAFCANKLEMNFFFDVDENSTTKPRLFVSSEYSKFNETSPCPEKINAAEYKEIPDVRLLGRISDSLDEAANAVSGKFHLNLTSTATMLSESSTSEEKDTITYGVENGAFYYDIQAVAQGQSVSMSYRNSVQTVTVAGQSENNPSSDDLAKAFVEQLLQQAMYDANAVTAVENTAEGQVLTLTHKDLTAFEPMITSDAIRLNTVTHSVTVKYDGERLTNMKGDILLNCSYQYGSTTTPMTIRVVADLTFETVQTSTVA